MNESLKRISDVIHSCENMDQIVVAQRYMDNYLKIEPELEELRETLNEFIKNKIKTIEA